MTEPNLRLNNDKLCYYSTEKCVCHIFSRYIYIYIHIHIYIHIVKGEVSALPFVVSYICDRFLPDSRTIPHRWQDRTPTAKPYHIFPKNTHLRDPWTPKVGEHVFPDKLQGEVSLRIAELLFDGIHSVVHFLISMVHTERDLWLRRKKEWGFALWCGIQIHIYSS